MTEERYNWLEREAASRDRLAGEAAIVGQVDRLGYLYCQTCNPISSEDAADPFTYPVAIWSDSPPHADEPCELCHKPLNQRPTASERIRTLRRNAVA